MKKHPTGLSLELRKQLLFSVFIFGGTVDAYIAYMIWKSGVYWIFPILLIQLYVTYFSFKNWRKEK